MSRSALLTNFIAAVVFSESFEKQQVRTGIVPIFDARITREPITFTYTTALPPSTATTAHTTQFKGPRLLPTLVPINHKESFVQTNYNLFNEKWQYFPAQPLTSKDIRTTPIYNQAQYYRAIQAGIYTTPPTITSSPYQEMWSRISDNWKQAKHTLVESGIERDWRSLWGKLSGALEPFMADFAEQLGRMVNTFMRQQNSRMKKLHRPDLNPFRLFRSERSPNDDEEAN